VTVQLPLTSNSRGFTGGLKPLVILWLILTAIMSYEYLALNKTVSYPSLLFKLKTIGLMPQNLRLTTSAGDTISFTLGIVGFTLICLTNLYIWRKRRNKAKPRGSISGWLDLHIFFGLMGPTMITFHSDFKVHGLVAISFWSMVVSFLSGIVGRYFYMQLLKERQEMLQTLKKYDEIFEKARLTAPRPWDKNILDEAKWQRFVHVGGNAALVTGNLALPMVLLTSVFGDIRRNFSRARLNKHLPKVLDKPLSDYALVKRRYLSSKHYKIMMGYWHTFHKPFAIFMYVVSIIHIAAALILRVQR
jgi:hypothetical protein